MGTPLRVGIVGCGQIAEHHLVRYREMVDVEVVACAAAHLESARAFAARHGIAESYQGYEELIASEEVDLIDICLHNRQHASAALAALERGRHVYVEKPMAATYSEALSMVTLARQRGLHLSVQLDSLFAAETRAARALIDDGALSKIYHARAVGHRRRGRPFVDGYGSREFVRHETAGGGALFDTGVYQLARLLYLLGNPTPLAASAQTYQRLDMPEERRKVSGFDVEEFVTGWVRFENGLTLDVVESWAAHVDSLGSSCILGERAGVRFDPFRYFFHQAGLDFDATTDLDAAKFRWTAFDSSSHSFKDSQSHTVAVLRRQCAPLPTAEVALGAMHVSELLYRSAKLGKEVCSVAH